jgi:integrase
MPRQATKLTRTPDGGWKTRKRIPEDVRDAFEKRWELFFKCGPMSETLARVRHRGWLSEIETQIANVRAARNGLEQALTLTQARALAGAWYHWFVMRHLAKAEPETAAHWEHLSSDLRDALHDAVRTTNDEWGLERADPFAILEDSAEAKERVRPMVADWAESAQFLHSKALMLDRASQNLFLDYLCKDLFAALHLLARRARGDFGEDQYASRFPKEDRPAVDPGLTPWLLFTRWVSESKPASSTVNGWRGVFLKLQDDFPEHSAAMLTTDAARTWAKGLINAKRSEGTVRGRWVRACHTVFEWARKQELLTHNPFAEVEIKVPRKIRLRDGREFSADEIRTILSSATTISQPRSKTDAVRRWVPWLLAYTGARAGEITQLRGSDVIEQDGIAAIKISPDAGSVKTRQTRTVPLHEHLMEQGFFAFVKANGKGPLFHKERIGPERKDDPTKPRKPLAVKAREHLAAWVRKLGVTDREISPNHAWRHTFKAIGHRHGISERVLDAIVGHAPPNVGRGYGGPTLRDKADALKAFPQYEVTAGKAA